MYRLLVISVALAIGCRDGGLSRLESIRDEVCHCKTAACGEAAMKRIGDTKVESNARSQRIARDMMECLARLYDGERPETGPDVEVTAPGSAAP